VFPPGQKFQCDPWGTLDDASLFQCHECTILVHRLQCAAAELDTDELAELRNPDALVLEVRRDRAFDHLGDVTTDTALFLGQTGTVDLAARADAGSSNTADACHKKVSLLELRDAENGDLRGHVKTNPHKFRLKFLQSVFAEQIQPALDIAEDGLLLLVIHQQMVGLGVIVVGFRGPSRDAGDEAADVRVVVEIVLPAVEHEHGLAEICRAVIHALNVAAEGADHPEGVLVDLVGVFRALFLVVTGLGHLQILPASQSVEGNPGKRQGGCGDLDQPGRPCGDVIAEPHNRGRKNEAVAGRVPSGSLDRCVCGDECTHALAEPDNLRAGMPFLDELGECEQIAVPVERIADVAATGSDRVAALAADLVSIESGVRLVQEEVVAKVGIVDRGPAESMDPNQDDILFGFFGNPLAVTKIVRPRLGGFLKTDECLVGCASRDAKRCQSRKQRHGGRVCEMSHTEASQQLKKLQCPMRSLKSPVGVSLRFQFIRVNIAFPLRNFNLL